MVVNETFEYDARIFQNTFDPILYLKRHDLIAFVSHTGTLGAGHNIGFCKNLDETWWKYKDAMTQQIIFIWNYMMNGRHGFTPCIFFYKRR